MCLFQICCVAFAMAKPQNSHYSGHNYGAGRDWHIDSFHGDKHIQNYQGKVSSHLKYNISLLFFIDLSSNIPVSVSTKVEGGSGGSIGKISIGGGATIGDISAGGGGGGTSFVNMG